MITLRPSQARGKADLGWLQSQHSFSFGSYYDADHMGFSALRVINDDHVAAGKGFATHSHANMEILSFVLEGEIAHRDSQGNVTQLPVGEFQLMSAGKGISHSEYNPLQQPLHFLQIWIQPNVQDQAPGYQQKHFGRNNGLTLVASPDGENGSLLIKQDVWIYQLLLQPGQIVELAANSQRHYYLHLVSGDLSLNSVEMTSGDGVKIKNHAEPYLLVNAGKTQVQALWFDLP
ncbi:MAG TPA: pirin family protein [Cellvibrionaceae bacterium]